jgi:hypothetical protein
MLRRLQSCWPAAMASTSIILWWRINAMQFSTSMSRRWTKDSTLCRWSSSSQIATKKTAVKQTNKQTGGEGYYIQCWRFLANGNCLLSHAERQPQKKPTEKKRSHQFGQKTCPQVVVQIGNWRTNKLGISAESPFFASWILVEARIWEKLKALEGDRCGSSWASGEWRW